MRLKPTTKGIQSLVNKQKEAEKVTKLTTTEKRQTAKKESFKDEYKPMFTPRRFLIRETPSRKDPTKKVKQYLEAKVQRFDDDEAMPNVFISMYQESEQYTGYLKGKSVYFPLEMLYTVMEELEELSVECDKRKIGV